MQRGLLTCVYGNQCELLRAKLKQEFLDAKKTYCCVTVAM